MQYRPASRFIDPDYTRKTRLLDATSVTRTPVLGTVLYDDSAIWRPVREYRRIHAAFPDVYAYHIDNPILSDEFIVHRDTTIFIDSSIHTADKKGQNALQIADRFSHALRAMPVAAPSEEYADDSALVLHNEGGGTWGHYVVQNFPKVLLFRQHFPAGKVVVPRPHTDRQHSNFARLFDVYGIPQDHLIPVDRHTSYRFRELILIDFMFDFPKQVAHPFTIDALAAFADSTLHAEAQTVAKQAVFVARSEDRHMRAIANQTELDPVLDKYGVPTRSLGAETVQQQIQAWQNSKLVISTLGSDLTNIIFGREGTRVLSLSPDWFGDMFFYNLAVAKRMQWNELRCGTLVEQAEVPHLSSFRVDPDLMDTMLETLMA
jgi:capsular polysaccharide biosynthesis protein